MIAQIENTIRDYENISYSEDREVFLSVKPIIEINPGLSFKLKNNFYIHLDGKLGYISKFVAKDEIHHSSKIEYEFGGMTYGGGMSLNLDF